jgi:ubiquitin-conjugating enzyme E2 O
MVNYRAGGLRLNPNLYACGKVCLSLLNTWTGSGCEKWNPANSTMLQVLVSIQALVLNAKPYFNEPGYAMHANTAHGEKKSLTYNEDTFLHSCRTMLYSLRNPPKVCLLLLLCLFITLTAANWGTSAWGVWCPTARTW